MKSLKIAIIVVALAAALLITVFAGSDEGPPAVTQEDYINWKCRVCGGVFSLSPQENREALAAVGGKAPITCKRCGKVEAYLPIPCTCGELILGADVPGSTGRCPKCEPNAEPIYDEPPPQEYAPGETPADAPPPERVRPKSV